MPVKKREDIKGTKKQSEETKSDEKLETWKMWYNL